MGEVYELMEELKATKKRLAEVESKLEETEALIAGEADCSHCGGTGQQFQPHVYYTGWGGRCGSCNGKGTVRLWQIEAAERDADRWQELAMYFWESRSELTKQYGKHREEAN